MNPIIPLSIMSNPPNLRLLLTITAPIIPVIDTMIATVPSPIISEESGALNASPKLPSIKAAIPPTNPKNPPVNPSINSMVLDGFFNSSITSDFVFTSSTMFSHPKKIK